MEVLEGGTARVEEVGFKGYRVGGGRVVFTADWGSATVDLREGEVTLRLSDPEKVAKEEDCVVAVASALGPSGEVYELQGVEDSLFEHYFDNREEITRIAKKRGKLIAKGVVYTVLL